jgi:ubiquinone/menaquinone biosynthesis C-methylase UbiE
MQPPNFSAPDLLQHMAQRLLRVAYQQLYTSFAWSYDAVAAAVSAGEWQVWGRAVLAFIDPPRDGQRVLELAHGPGHVQLALRQRGYAALGLDLSAQMSALAARRLHWAGYTPALLRASVFHLPFPADTFDALISTFPTEFIAAPLMAAEAWRVLRAGGRLVVVPTAIAQRADPLTRAVNALQRGGSRTASRPAALMPHAPEVLAQAGFAFREHQVPTPRAQVIVWVFECEKPKTGD